MLQEEPSIQTKGNTVKHHISKELLTQRGILSTKNPKQNEGKSHRNSCGQRGGCPHPDAKDPGRGSSSAFLLSSSPQVMGVDPGGRGRKS